MPKPDFVQLDAVAYSGIKRIRKLDVKEDVYCLKANKNGTMVANGIITKNCDALRYAVFTHKCPSFENTNEDPMEELKKARLHPGGSRWT